VALAEGCWGALLLIAPDPLLDSVAGDPVDDRVVFAVRLLGARHLLQAIVTRRRPTRRRVLAGATVNAAHAASMIGLAVADVGPRRLTLASATTATALAAAAAVAAARRPADQLSDASAPRPQPLGKHEL
jgi:hypothetical protein